MKKLPSNIKYIVGIRTLVETTCGTYSGEEVYKVGTTFETVGALKLVTAKRKAAEMRRWYARGYYPRANGWNFGMTPDQFEIFIEKVWDCSWS